jgi:hypothetical protein
MKKESDVELQSVHVNPNANAPHDSASLYLKVPMWQQPKQGGKCCGCCCDYRRAVIILAIIRLVFNVINVPLLTLAADQTGASTSSGVEDGEEGQEAVFNGTIGNPVFLMSMAIFTAAASLVGALKFDIRLVAIDLVWFVGKYSIGYYYGSHQILDERLSSNNSRNTMPVLDCLMLIFCRLISLQ